MGAHSCHRTTGIDYVEKMISSLLIQGQLCAPFADVQSDC